MSKILGSVPENFSKLGKIYGPGLLPSVVLMFELGLDKKYLQKFHSSAFQNCQWQWQQTNLVFAFDQS